MRSRQKRQALEPLPPQGAGLSLLCSWNVSGNIWYERHRYNLAEMKLPLLLTALVALCLTGCQSQTPPPPQEPAVNMGTSHVPPAPGIATTPESFVGTWQKNNLVRVLRSDGTGAQTGGALRQLKFRWPLHGHYVCATCGRLYPVPWANLDTVSHRGSGRDGQAIIPSGNPAMIR